MAVIQTGAETRRASGNSKLNELLRWAPLFPRLLVKQASYTKHEKFLTVLLALNALSIHFILSQT